jgi:predicted branched-subunit amino acid permease
MISALILADFTISEIPQKVGELFGIPEPNTALIGGAIAGMILFIAIVMPSLLFPNKSLALVFGFLALTLDVALGWIPSWAMLMSMLLIAGLFARQISKWFR